MGLTRAPASSGSPAVHELADAQPDQPTLTAERRPAQTAAGRQRQHAL